MTPIYEFPSDLSITADPAKAVPALLEELRSQMTAEQKRRCQARLERYQAEGRQRLDLAVETANADRAHGIISPLCLSYQIGQTLGPEAVIAHELVDSSMFNRSRPGTLLGTGGSSIGWAAPAAVGAKVAAGDRPVVACIGDGSWMFGNPQVTAWSSAFHRAPVLFIVWNNRGYRTGTAEVLRTYPEGYAAKQRDFTGGWFDPTRTPGSGGDGACPKVTDPGGQPGHSPRSGGHGARSGSRRPRHVDAQTPDRRGVVMAEIPRPHAEHAVLEEGRKLASR
jgi:acetolactate synthase-1/2/3 large subunit